MGYYSDSIGEHGFLYSGGTYTTLDQPTGIGYFTVAYDINNSGQIVGYGFAQDGQKGFLYSGGVYTIIDPPGSVGTYTIAINDLAQVVGFYADSSNHYHGFLYSGGTYTTLDFPGANYTYLDDINDWDRSSGDTQDNTGQHGFVYSEGTFTIVEPSSGANDHAINASGQIIGNVGFGFLATPLPLPVMLNAVLANNLTTLSGTAEANSSVSVFDGTNLVGIVSAAADGTWSLQANIKGNVVHSFTETSIDLAGNSASSAGVTLYTPAANKVLRGGNGNDVLIGAPNDTLTGGPGADTLVFNPSFGKETIRDYNVNQDVLAFNHTLFANDTASQVLN